MCGGGGGGGGEQGILSRQAKNHSAYLRQISIGRVTVISLILVVVGAGIGWSR